MRDILTYNKNDLLSIRVENLFSEGDGDETFRLHIHIYGFNRVHRVQNLQC